MPVVFCASDSARRGDNSQIVKDAHTRLDQMQREGKLSGGGLLKIHGPASLPVAMALSHKLAHLFEAVAWFDPKLDKYVVAISHSPKPGVCSWGVGWVRIGTGGL